MDFKEYQALARRTQNKELMPVERRLHALHGMSAEVGEIHSIYQKFYQGHTVDYDELIKEMGDLMWFMCELCDCIGIELEDVCRLNIEKLKKRYPEGFDEEKSRSRHKTTTLDEIKSIAERMESVNA